MFGIINCYKPPGMTSHDVVAKLRKVFNLKKVGHLGTLDPFAEGVLPVCIGKATRLIEYFPTDKAYEATVCFGKTTTTLDPEGEVTLEQACPNLTATHVEAVLPQFTGEILQQVPMHAAVHVKGKKLYELARQVVEQAAKENRPIQEILKERDITLPTRPVTIHKLNLLNFTPGEFPTAVIDVHCSSGTYIRALGRDIGEALRSEVAEGVSGAYLTKLVRTKHGLFKIEDAVSLETLQTASNPIEYLLDPLPFLTQARVNLTTADRKQLLIYGTKIAFDPEETSKHMKGNDLGIALHNDQLIAIVQRDGDQLKALKVFSQPASFTGGANGTAGPL